MRLRKAPIIEAWIGFVFEPSPSKRSWDLDTARNLLERYKDSMGHLEAVHALALQVKKVAPNVRAEVVREQANLVSIRAHDADQERWLQLAEDRLVYNLVLPGAKYPGFETLLEEAMQKCDDYVATFAPQSVKDAEIHYVDVVEITCAHGELVELTDYFRVLNDLSPKPFGITAAFSAQYTLMAEPIPDKLEMQFQYLSDSSPTCLKVRMDWHRTCAGLGTLDREAIKSRMLAARGHIQECFRASFTEKTWALFEPDPEQAL